MVRKTRVSKGKTMRPNYFVFCEGETEVSYVKFLRSQYRVPIQIIAKKSDSNISIKFVENSKRVTDIHDPLSTEECLNRLLARLPDYLKGKLTEEHKKILAENVIAAISRAKKLKKNENPSSSIYLLIESLS